MPSRLHKMIACLTLVALSSGCAAQNGSYTYQAGDRLNGRAKVEEKPSPKEVVSGVFWTLTYLGLSVLSGGTSQLHPPSGNEAQE